MLDLTNITLSSLLTASVQENTEPGALPGFMDDAQQEDNQVIDASTFVLFFAEAAAMLPRRETNEVESAEVTAMVETTTQPVVVESSDKFEENVAVAWINSPYYQSEPLNEKQDSSLEDTAVAALEINEIRETSETEVRSDPGSETKNKPDSSLMPEIVAPLVKEKPSSEIVPENKKPVAIMPESEFKAVAESIQKDIKNTERPGDGESLLKNEPVEQPVKKDTLTKLRVEPALMKKNEDSNEEFSLDRLHSDKSILSEPENPVKTSSNISFDVVPKTLPMEQHVNPDVAISQSVNSTQSFINERMLANNPKTLETPQTLTIPVDVESPQWSAQFSQQVVWLSQQGMKNAVIKVHPEDLGPLEISITMTHDNASVNIISHSAQVRDIIDQSLPRLQEMMMEQGLNLAEVTIDSNEARREQEQGTHETAAELAAMDIEEEELQTVSVKTKTTSQGIIDYFA